MPSTLIDFAAGAIGASTTTTAAPHHHHHHSASSTMRSVLKRLSVALPRPHSHHSQPRSRSHSSEQVFTAPQPLVKRAPCVSKSYKTPAEQQLASIDLVVQALEGELSANALEHPPREEDELYSCFHGSKVPEIALRDYLIRLVKYANNFCEDEARADSSGVRCMFIALEYLARSGALLHANSVHRYLLTAFLIAIKGMEDFVMEHSFWSAVGGCSVRELNLYEARFLHKLDFRCHVTNAQFNKINHEFGSPCEELVE